MNKYEAAVPAHMRGLWAAICAAEADAERDALLRQWAAQCGKLERRMIWLLRNGAMPRQAVRRIDGSRTDGKLWKRPQQMRLI